MGLLAVGPDVLLAILQDLPVPSVLAVRSTSRLCSDIADSDALWALLFKRDWGSAAVDLETGRKSCCSPATQFCRSALCWKSLYKQMLALGSIKWSKLHHGNIVPAARCHSMVALADRVALFGDANNEGHDSWITSIPDDLSENIIWQPASLGRASSSYIGQSCTLVEDTLVRFGGVKSRGRGPCGDTWINRGIHGGSTEERASWQLLEVAAAPPGRSFHAGCYAGDKKVVVNGGVLRNGTVLEDTWVLDLSETPLPTWHQVITLHSPPARSRHTLTWVGGKRMVLFGGMEATDDLNDVWLLDMEGEFPTWEELREDEFSKWDECPTPRVGHSATLIFGGRVLIYGGEDARRHTKGDVWVLDISAGVPVGDGSMCMERFHDTRRSGGKFARKFWKKMKQQGRPPSKRLAIMACHAACSMHSGHAVLVSDLGSELFMLELVP